MKNYLKLRWVQYYGISTLVVVDMLNRLNEFSKKNFGVLCCVDICIVTTISTFKHDCSVCKCWYWCDCTYCITYCSTARFYPRKKTRVEPGYPLSAFAPPLFIHFLIFCSLLFSFSFSSSLYLCFSVVHPIPFYQIIPTSFPGVRS